MTRRIGAVAAVLALTGAILTFTGTPSQAGPRGRFAFHAQPGRPQLSGPADPRLMLATAGVITPRGLAAAPAAVASDDVQANGDNKTNPLDQFGTGAGLPQNETSIAINPTNPKNVIVAANDYEPGVDATIGLYVSFDGGKTFPYSRHAPQILTPDRIMYGAGDPALSFDRDGVAYAAYISFGRSNFDSYIGVSRSTDGGITWSDPADGFPPVGTYITPGDGIVAHNGGPNDAVVFHDKDAMTVGPRPAGAPLVPGSDQLHISPDRIYVTWTRFVTAEDGSTVESPIVISYSDDQGRHWSAMTEISGSAPFCSIQNGDQDGTSCDEDQFSSPVVDHRNGTVYVAFENSNTDGQVKNRYAIVSSTDGGATFSAPSFVTDIFDGATKYPICQGSQTLDVMCARIDAAGNLDMDQTTGRLYISLADNRNGTDTDTNNDVFVTSSTTGGRTWSKPVNVTAGSVDDQVFPWLSVTPDGVVAVSYLDRRYSGPKLFDTSLSVSTNDGKTFSTRRVSERPWNPDLAFRLGLFIGDYTGLATTRGLAIPCWTDARFAEPNFDDNNPPNQQSDIMVDAETIPNR